MDKHSLFGSSAKSGTAVRSGSPLFASGARVQAADLMQEVTGTSFHSMEQNVSYDAFVARVQAGGFDTWISDRVHDLAVAGAYALKTTGLSLNHTAMTAAITMAPDSFVRGIFRNKDVQDGLLKFLQNSAFFDIMLQHSSVLTAAVCGMKFEAEFSFPITSCHGARVRRIVCDLPCQQKQAQKVAAWMMDQGKPGTNLFAKAQRGLAGIVGSAIQQMLNIPALLADLNFRSIIFSELSNSRALLEASTPEIWRALLVDNAYVVAQPTGFGSRSFSASVTNVQYRPKEEPKQMHATAEVDTPGLLDTMIYRMISSIGKLGVADLVEWLMMLLMDDIMKALRFETTKDATDLFFDSSIAKLANAMFADLQIDAAGSWAKMPIRISSMKAKIETQARRQSKWNAMNCSKQVRLAKREQAQVRKKWHW